MAAPEVFSHSDLEVAPNQPNPRFADKYYANDPASAPRYYYAPDGAKERTICGLRAATFFLTVALILVILAATISRRVGETMAVNNAKKYFPNLRILKQERS